MRKIFLLTAALCAAASLWAQTPDEGVPYYLPKTRLHFRLLVECTLFTPGQLAGYAERYLKQQVRDQPSTTYRLVGISLSADALPDSAKRHTLIIDRRHTIATVDIDRSGILKAVNATGRDIVETTPFVPAAQPRQLVATNYMSQDILTAGNSAKMAQLTAQEIYDIRESRSLLSRGEADYMPADGEQLRIMLANLDVQERALTQAFTGVTTVDTTESEVTYVPDTAVSEAVLFRLSKYYGLVDDDDLAGEPYYIKIEDLHVIPALTAEVVTEKKAKDDIDLFVNLPGKIKVCVEKDNKTIKAYEVYAAQYGRTENISAELFGKRMTSHLVLDPITGNIVSLKTDMIE